MVYAYDVGVAYATSMCLRSVMGLSPILATMTWNGTLGLMFAPLATDIRIVRRVVVYGSKEKDSDGFFDCRKDLCAGWDDYAFRNAVCLGRILGPRCQLGWL